MNTSMFTGLVLRSPRASVVAVAAALSLAACGGGSDDPIRFDIGGTVEGLTAAGLVLTNNSGDDLGLASGATNFLFAQKVDANTGYQVAVKMQPTGLTCEVAGGSGTATADVYNVAVLCAPSGGGTDPGPNPDPDPDPGPGPGGDGDGSNAAACFNELLMKPGTRYQWDMQGTVNGKTVTMLDTATVHGGASFNGVSGLTETRQALTLTVGGVLGVNQDTQTFHALDRSNGPVVTTHGAISTGTVGGMAINMRLEYNPPAAMRDFTLAVGESYEYVETINSTTSVGGTPVSFTDTTRQTTTYQGLKQVTVPAGTFMACHFKSQTEDGLFEHYHAKGSGLPVIMSSVADGKPVTLEMLPSSSVNGTPVAAFQAAY